MLLKRLFKSFKTQYYGIYDSLKNYVRFYGGVCSFLTSPYLHISIALSIYIVYFSGHKTSVAEDIIDAGLTIFPSLLGLAMAVMAIFVSTGNDEFKFILCGGVQKRKSPSAFLRVTATFAHFTIINIITILNAICIKALGLSLINDIYVLFTLCISIYSVLLAIATVFALMRIAIWVRHFYITSYGSDNEKSDKTYEVQVQNNDNGQIVRYIITLKNDAKQKGTTI